MSRSQPSSGSGRTAYRDEFARVHAAGYAELVMALYAFSSQAELAGRVATRAFGRAWLGWKELRAAP